MQKYILEKNPLKETKILQDIITLQLNLKFQQSQNIIFQKSSEKSRSTTQGPKSLKLLYSIINLNTISLLWQASPTKGLKFARQDSVPGLVPVLTGRADSQDQIWCLVLIQEGACSKSVFILFSMKLTTLVIIYQCWVHTHITLGI